MERILSIAKEIDFISCSVASFNGDKITIHSSISSNYPKCVADFIKESNTSRIVLDGNIFDELPKEMQISLNEIMTFHNLKVK